MVFSPFTLPGGLSLKNRLVVAPMTTYSSLPDGVISPDELPYLHRRAAGGFGMVMTAACYVHPTGHAFEGQWGCSDDAFLPSLRSAAQAIQSGGATAVLQIHHGGRMCPGRLCGGQPISASDVRADRPTAETPRPMTEAEIDEVLSSYAAGARRAKEAGFDGVEIHGANTYLIQQFVSPETNLRDDQWGEDKYLFACETVDRVRAAVGANYPVGYRFSPEELEPNGIRLAHTLELLDRLRARSLAWLHISLGKWNQPSLRGEYEEPTLTLVRRHLGDHVPLIGVGGVFSLADAEACLEACDLVAIGKAAISEPEWPAKALTEGPIRTTIPATNAAQELTLPLGLERKIYAVSGWFQVETPTESETVAGSAPR
jgi:2,4-dienoyl-CoA reductase-like NADH-dependent reductase (Old Yellow Enzyme family)